MDVLTPSRRRFLEISALSTFAAAPLLARGRSSGPAPGRLLLAGTQTGAESASRGIYAYRFDSATGDLVQIGLACASESPTFLALSPDGELVYSVNEIRESEGRDGGSVSSFRLDRRTGMLTPINRSFSKGAGPTHIAVDHTGRSVFAANYGGGSVVSFRAERDGRLSDAVSFFQYTANEEEHQRHPHAHRVTVSPDNRFLLVNDLGLDVIHVYRLDAAKATLTPHDPPHWRATSGAGPRALHFHPNGRLAYSVNELKPTVDLLGWDGARGILTTIAEISLVPGDYHGNSAPSDIAFDREMRFAYVASRLDDFMATFGISPDGRLTMLGRSTCGGRRPRHITLDPEGRWLLVANQDTDTIAVIRRDGRTGRLADQARTFPLAKPQCLIFA